MVPEGKWCRATLTLDLEIRDSHVIVNSTIGRLLLPIESLESYSEACVRGARLFQEANNVSG